MALLRIASICGGLWLVGTFGDAFGTFFMEPRRQHVSRKSFTRDGENSSPMSRSVHRHRQTHLLDESSVQFKQVTVAILPASSAESTPLNLLPADEGDKQEETLMKDDISRLTTRLEGVGTYATVSALMATMGNMLANTTSPANLPSMWRPMRFIFCWTLVLCVISGLYSTTIFSMTKLYGQAAIGMKKDAALITFLDNTARYRKQAYYAYCITIFSFAATFLMAFSVRWNGSVGLTSAILGACLLAQGIKDFIEFFNGARVIFQK